MATSEHAAPHDPARLSANLAKIEQLSQRLLAVLARKQATSPALQAPGPELFARAATALWSEALLNPARMFERQLGYWGETLRNMAEAGLQPRESQPGDADAPPLPYPDAGAAVAFLNRQQALNVQTVLSAVDGSAGLPEAERRRLHFFAGEIMKLFRPANYLGTNPEALTRAVESNGQSLVDGLENLVRDLEANDGELVVSLADRDAFQVGENLAASEGAVVYRNRLFELIQYAPRTEKVHRTPLLIFPPWINKYYILDLNEKNSLVRWLVGQGFTLFVVSWANPDASCAETGMADYVQQGFLEAMAQVRRATGEKKINVVGYCIGGTTLALTLALMKKRKDRSVKSATFFTTLTDFTDPGDVSVFLADDFMDGIRAEVREKGVLDALFMSRTFSFLRSDDLIYGPAIRRYLMGEAPPAFDLLYWNGDGTNLPGRMAVEYLEGLCRENRFAGGTFDLGGEPLSIRDVDVPFCAIACETDHIAPWRSSLAGIAAMGSRDKTFILSQSGHIAGIVNPPGRRKYGHYTSDAPLSAGLDADRWLAGASFHEGSWWPRWGEWLAGRSGAMVPARTPGDGALKALDKAPGRYVLKQAHPQPGPG